MVSNIHSGSDGSNIAIPMLANVIDPVSIANMKCIHHEEHNQTVTRIYYFDGLLMGS